MKLAIALLAVLSLVGCMPEKAKSPEVHMCKVYADEPTCVADELCKWKQGADGAYKCKAK